MFLCFFVFLFCLSFVSFTGVGLRLFVVVHMFIKNLKKSERGKPRPLCICILAFLALAEKTVQNF